LAKVGVFKIIFRKNELADQLF